MRRPLSALVILLACEDDVTIDPVPLAWTAGDVHLHHACPSGNFTSAELADRMADEDLQVGSPLAYLVDYDVVSPTFDGKDDPISRPGRIVHPDLELSGFPAADFGHALLLGLSSIHFTDDPLGSPRAEGPILDWALAQGPRVLVGYAHAWAWPEVGYPAPGGCCTPFEFPIQVARGKVSFLSEEANPDNAAALGARLDDGPLSAGGFVLWRAMQNMGYRVPLAGGSDIGCLSERVGSPRTLALVSGALTYDAYLDAIRAGRTEIATTAGETLDFHVDGANVGDEVSLVGPSEVSIATSVDAEILVNGVSAGHVTRVRIASSSWIVARTKNVQTSAIYVLVAGAPIRASADDACFMAKYVDALRGIATAPLRSDGRYDLRSELTATLAEYDEAKTAFLDRFHESGGTDCH